MVILCGLALLAAMMCLALFFQEKKRNEKRRAAMIHLIQEECGTVAQNSYERCQQIQDNLEEMVKIIEALQEKIYDLEKGVIPDYEKARQAVDEVNKFNEGLSNMLGFDPLESMKKARNSTGGDR